MLDNDRGRHKAVLQWFFYSSCRLLFRIYLFSLSINFEFSFLFYFSSRLSIGKAGLKPRFSRSTHLPVIENSNIFFPSILFICYFFFFFFYNFVLFQSWHQFSKSHIELKMTQELKQIMIMFLKITFGHF